MTSERRKIILGSETHRQFVGSLVATSPPGCLVTIDPPRRTINQNDASRLNTNELMLRSELSQAQRQIQAIALQREQYIRLTIVLANMIRLKGETKIVDGHVAIDKAAFEDVPAKWQVGLGEATVRAEGVPETEAGEDVIVVMVSEKPTNGAVAAPPAPRLVLPGGA